MELTDEELQNMICILDYDKKYMLARNGRIYNRLTNKYVPTHTRPTKESEFVSLYTRAGSVIVTVDVFVRKYFDADFDHNNKAGTTIVSTLKMIPISDFDGKYMISEEGFVYNRHTESFVRVDCRVKNTGLIHFVKLFSENYSDKTVVIRTLIEYYVLKRKIKFEPHAPKPVGKPVREIGDKPTTDEIMQMVCILDFNRIYMMNSAGEIYNTQTGLFLKPNTNKYTLAAGGGWREQITITQLIKRYYLHENIPLNLVERKENAYKKKNVVKPSTSITEKKPRGRPRKIMLPLTVIEKPKPLVRPLQWKPAPKPKKLPKPLPEPKPMVVKKYIRNKRSEPVYRYYTPTTPNLNMVATGVYWLAAGYFAAFPDHSNFAIGVYTSIELASAAYKQHMDELEEEKDIYSYAQTCISEYPSDPATTR